MIQIIVNTVYAQIVGLEDIAIIDAISSELSYFEPGYKYVFAYKIGKWDGQKKLLTTTMKFPTGLLHKVCGILKLYGIVFEVNESVAYPEGLEPLTWHGPALYDYQTEVMQKMFAPGVRRGLVRVATGGGKSLLISKQIAELNVKTNVFVISLDLMSQIKETLEKCLKVEIGQIGGGICNIKKINVVSIYTAGLACGQKELLRDADEDANADKWDPSEIQRAEIKAVIQDAELCILDEAHYGGASTVQTILNNSRSAIFRFGYSGTPWRTGGDDILLEASFGKQICDVSASLLIQKGFLVPPKIIFRDIDEYHIKLPKKWPAIKAQYIVNNEHRNKLLIDNCVRLLQMGRRPLMLFREINHGKKLLSILPDDVKVRMVNGSLSGEERTEIRNDFKKGKIDLLLASTVFDCGIDLGAIDAIVKTPGGKSTSRALQRIGRGIRSHPGKTDCLVVETFDQAHYVKEHSLIRYDIYKTEPEFKIKVGPEMEKALRKRK